MTTTVRTHSGAVVAHALAAVAAHMLEHELPAPDEINLPTRYVGDFDGLTISVQPADAFAWINTGFDCDVFDDGRARSMPPHYRIAKADGRLTDSGVRVRIQYVVLYDDRSAVSA
jgi:hypothetical protein